jgi:RNA polymerase-binding transcription factor
MARTDALLRLHKSLLARRADLNKKLAEDINNLRNYTNTESPGDSADAAFESGSDEMASQLAEIDARELSQIERALVRLKQGTYGLCEGCQSRIPVGRLNALPYTTVCIDCQREMEKYPDWDDRRHGANWEKVYDAANRLEEPRELNLSEIEIDLSK